MDTNTLIELWASAGEVLEYAVLLSIKLEDEGAFERNYLQLHSYYLDQR